jgi:hypothetical protein
MLSKFAIAGLAATAFIAATALMSTGAAAGGRGGSGNWPQPGLGTGRLILTRIAATCG